VFVYCYTEKDLSDTVHKCVPQLRKLYLHDMAAFSFLVYHHQVSDKPVVSWPLILYKERSK
jgi:hypothetical protein